MAMAERVRVIRRPSRKKVIFPVAALLFAGFLLAVTPPGKKLIGFMADQLPFLSQGSLSVESRIDIIPKEDINKNGEVDSGDSVRFTYAIRNTTKKTISDFVLETNINRHNINFVHNFKGASGFSDTGDAIFIPNVTLQPSQMITVSFDARANYDIPESHITTRPELKRESKTVATTQESRIAVKSSGSQGGPIGSKATKSDGSE